MKSYYLGCPVWTCPAWRGSIYPPKASKQSWLQHYSRAFLTVEGNSTFYGVPAVETFQRWADQTEDGFRFCFKFPRSVSHDKQLRNVERDLEPFLKGLAILETAKKLGPTFLQLGPSFDTRFFDRLVAFCRQFPNEFPLAVEVRHPDWFQPEGEATLLQFLREQNINRVIFDSRPLFSAPPSDESESKSQARKPKSPVRFETTGTTPLIRFVGRNDVSATQPWLDEWVTVIAKWINSGLTPFFFTHTPDDQFAPELARLFHNALAQKVPCLEPMEHWPGNAEPVQRQLF